jgi:beta-lactam-binding protein with PASTA domain
MSNESIKKEEIGKEEVKLSYFGPIGKLALIFFLGFSLYLFVSSMMLVFLTRSSVEIKTPSVVGKKYVDVSNLLVRKGLKPDIKFVDVYDLDDGIVLSQNPESGAILPENSTLRLTVSRSNFYIDVPSLVGTEYPIAVNKLKNLHFLDKAVSISPGVVSYIPSESKAENVVIDQSPKAGIRITPDVKVNLLVSSGSTTAGNKMPDVTGQSIDLCFDLLLAKGLTVQQEIVKTGDIRKSGIIASQSIPSGRVVPEKGTVKLGIYFYDLKDQRYSAYEQIDYTIPVGEPEGLYEIMVEDNHSKRIVYSSMLKGGQKMKAVFNRVGNARIFINRDKKNIKVMSLNVD